MHDAVLIDAQARWTVLKRPRQRVHRLDGYKAVVDGVPDGHGGLGMSKRLVEAAAARPSLRGGKERRGVDDRHSHPPRGAHRAGAILNAGDDDRRPFLTGGAQQPVLFYDAGGVGRPGGGSQAKPEPEHAVIERELDLRAFQHHQRVGEPIGSQHRLALRADRICHAGVRRRT